MATYFGRVSFEMSCDVHGGVVSGFVESLDEIVPHLVLHVRMPGNRKIRAGSLPSGASLGDDGDAIWWRNVRGKVEFEVAVE